MKKSFTTTKEIENFINSFPNASYHYYHFNFETKEENVFFRSSEESAKKISEELGIQAINTSTKWYKLTLSIGTEPVIK